jgi:hypothetical protein
MKNSIDLLASLDQDFVNCFYSISINHALHLQGKFVRYAEMLNVYTFPVQLTRTDATGTQYFQGVLIINGVQIEIVLTHG